MCSDLVHQKCNELCISLSKKYIFFNISEKKNVKTKINNKCIDEFMNWFCGMVDQRKAFSLISSWDHCQRSSLSRISDTPRAGFGPAQNLSSGFVE